MFTSEFEGNIPLLFFSFLYQKIARHRLITVLDLNEMSPKELQERLYVTSLLPQQPVFWLSDSFPKEARSKKEMVKIMTQYRGGGIIVGYLPIKQLSCISDGLAVTLPTKITPSLLALLAMVMGDTSYTTHDVCIVNAYDYLRTKKKVPIDRLCIILWYYLIAGKNSIHSTQYVERIMGVEHTLFTLSAHMFKREIKQFFDCWNSLYAQYSAPFWVSFWSEQLWRAACYVLLKQKGNHEEAKKVTYFLPFSFINYDWRKCDPAQCMVLHDYLYSLETRIKNGTGEKGEIEIVCLSYMLHISPFASNVSWSKNAQVV
ncbi:MAG: hypothetical protein WBQ73_03750 [Candidatus Babeliales bacterium]